jgi:hypothetical protein
VDIVRGAITRHCGYYGEAIEKAAKADDKANRVMTVPAIDPVIATAVAAMVRDMPQRC